jgi:hypothetical protein
VPRIRTREKLHYRCSEIFLQDPGVECTNRVYRNYPFTQPCEIWQYPDIFVYLEVHNDVLQRPF